MVSMMSIERQCAYECFMRPLLKHRNTRLCWVKHPTMLGNREIYSYWM